MLLSTHIAPNLGFKIKVYKIKLQISCLVIGNYLRSLIPEIVRKYYIYGNFCVIDPTYVVNSGGSTSPDGSGTVGAGGSSNSAGDQDFSSKLTSLKIVESENDKTGTEKLSYALKKADEACGIALEDDRYEIDRKISQSIY